MNAPPSDLPLADLYAESRARCLDALGDAAALVFGYPHRLRNADIEYRYRAHSDVLYLSGWADPDCAVLLRPGTDAPFVMFVQPREPERERWTGRRPGPEGAAEVFGADVAHPISELAERLPKYLTGFDVLHYRFGEQPERDLLVRGALNRALRAATRKAARTPHTIVDPVRVLHEQRLIKSPAELALLRRSAALTAQAHRRAMAITTPGVGEWELESAIEGIFRSGGGTGPGYPSIVGGGTNATILHYNSNRDLLRGGDLVCVDAGCEYNWYTTDVTRTWPVSGRFTPPQATLYQVVLAAQKAAIEACVVGATWRDLEAAAYTELTAGLVALGLLEGDVAELVEDAAYKPWTVHGLGHWLGLDVHDAGAYCLDGAPRPLQAGMVLTIEPGLYIPDDPDAPEGLAGAGIRIEDDVLVTAGGPVMLTAALPRELEEIERLVGSAR